jgi:hypothetical protein
LLTSPLTVLFIAIGLVLAGQVAEDLADSPPIQLVNPTSALRRWTVIVAVAYMLVISGVIDRMIERSLLALDRLVDIDPVHFERYMARMRRLGLGVNAALLGVSALVVGLIFLVLRTSLPIDDPVTNAPTFLPSKGLGAAAILVEYTIVGWAVLSLVWNTVRRARALGQLSREPLQIDVFDTSNVLPLGNIALATALAPAGLIVILLFGFGRPSAPISWTVLLLVSVAGVFALLLPLRGIHRQMETAKDRALSELNARLGDSYAKVNTQSAPTNEAASSLNNRVSTLINLRKTVGEMTTWPFRDTIALGRAVLIALAPLIYAVINELIKKFFLNPITP